jgi:pimeloyl-ACP methyl ester carboxylesterase
MQPPRPTPDEGGNRMPELTIDGVTIAYDLVGEGEPVALLSGCSQPAVAWHLSLVPALAAAGYQVLTFDNRGVEPSSSPPAPYSVDDMVGDALNLFDHLGFPSVRIAGHSMGGWIAERLTIDHPDRVRAAVFMGSCNVATSWEKAITTVERDLARLDADLPPLFYATETLRYLPNSELQDDGIVDAWLSMIGDLPPWPNPGRLGQYEACLAWSNDLERTKGWSAISKPCLVMAFEHDVDSPPARAREAAATIPGCRFEEIPGASHLGVFTHGPAVADLLVDFFAGT